MPTSLRLDRRAFLTGVGGVSLALPVLDAMGREATIKPPRRFCAMYTANGMSLPQLGHKIDEWSWFPRAEKDGQFVFGKSTEPLAPFRKQLSFLGGLHHPSGPKADPHVCSDMWLTGAAAAQPEAWNVQHGRARSGGGPAHPAVLPPAVARALDRCRHGVPLPHRHHLVQPRRPADPRREQPTPGVRQAVPRRQGIADHGTGQSEAADQAGGCGRRERTDTQPATRQGRPRADGTVPHLAR